MDTRKTESFLNVDLEAYLARHDLVYESPAEMPFHGLPLGDGATGALAWTPPDALRFELGRCDLWDDGPERPFNPWGKEDEEVASALRSAGHISIAPGLPVLDRLYLSDFEMRLDLHAATANLRSVTPLGKIEAEMFMPQDSSVLAIDYRDELSEPVPREIRVERWGTRTFGHWYQVLRREPELGLDGTEAGTSGDVAWVSQQTRTTRFAVAVAVEGIPLTVNREHSRAGRFVSEPIKKASFRVYVAVVSSFQADDPVAEAVARVTNARNAGIDRLRSQHRAAWADFWSRSFVQIPDDYVENLWYLNHYTMGSGSRGDYPPSFINGIWPPTRDSHAWNHNYHWNQQEIAWPGATAGHPELANGWLSMQHERLPQAAESAKRRFNASGAWFFDVFDRRGFQCEGPPLLTPGLQASLDVWRTWRHSGDEKQLREIGWPIMRETSRFYLDMLKPDEDGIWHMPASQPYEHAAHYEVRDCLADIAHVAAAFPKVADVADLMGDAEFAAQLRDVADNLAEPELIPIPDSYLRDDGTLALGHAAGRKPPSDNIVTVGRRLEDNVAVYFRCEIDGIGSDFLFPGVNESLVYPSGALGIADRDTELFEAMKTTALAHYEDGGNTSGAIGVMGWSIAQITFARLGMREELAESLDRHVEWFQHFPNGMWSYHPGMDGSDVDLGGVCNVRDWADDSEEPERFPFPQQPHTHFGLEPGAVLQTTVNEMLIQSYEGIIRLAPAVPEEWNTSFTLWAEGGFRVSCIVRSGTVIQAEVLSTRGEECRLSPDWRSGPDGWEIRNAGSGGRTDARIEGDAVVFATEVGASYRVLQSGSEWESVEVPSGESNLHAKAMGKRRLGLPRMW
jgi:alpha-L-fucosidase 2